jgi:uracil permease
MTAPAKEEKLIGYLPNDVPPIGQMILLGFQHVLTMFPATVLVALLVGFDVSAVLFISGAATITALILSRIIGGKFIPLYYGSSFSYIAATLALTNAEFATYAGDSVRLAQVGIVATGVVNILVGFLIRFIGKETLDKILPPVVTGSVAAVIGIALAFAALDMAQDNWGIALLTLLATILISVYLQGKGFVGLLPVLFGAIFGYLLSMLFDGFGLYTMNYDPLTSANWFVLPKFTLPAFGDPKAWSAVGTIAVIAIATIPESTAHLYQISLYVDQLAKRKKEKPYRLSELIGLNLILDGLGDLINGLFGGVAGTNYGENNSLMVITRNYSGPSLIAAGVIAILLGFVGKLAGLVNTVPLAVTGGLAIYLFGVIGMQGVALMLAEKVNLYDPKQLAIGATILVIGIGGHIGFGGNLPIPILPGIFPDGLPAIATAAVAGILLNAIFLIFKTPEVPPMD